VKPEPQGQNRIHRRRDRSFIVSWRGTLAFGGRRWIAACRDHLDKDQPQVAYVVASFGGFLGIGENLLPLPWKALSYDTRLGGYVVDTDRNRLERAPRYMPSELPDWSDRSYTEEIDRYWIPPV
jgi:hypothetical protein